MSTEKRNAPPKARGPVHDGVAFDPRDVRSGSILKFLLALAGTLVVVFLVSWWVLRMNETPRVTVKVTPTENHPSGIGEVGLPPIAPAIANAVAAITGKRLRTLPLEADLLKA